jgi:transcription-repair coupling factor (superfamily II helicase)
MGVDERVIRDAIRREMKRGGQVFFLHNRVKTIDQMAARIRELVPEARIITGHGQMHKDDLEVVMHTFVNGGADVLSATTIIETGIDIPNANPILSSPPKPSSSINNHQSSVVNHPRLKSASPQGKLAECIEMLRAF